MESAASQSPVHAYMSAILGCFEKGIQTACCDFQTQISIILCGQWLIKDN